MSNQLTELDPSIRHGYAQVGDVRLHYAECGGGDRLVILLHGFPECWYSWRHQLAALGEHYRVVAPDMRGYNLSDKPPRVDDYRNERLVDDVIGLIRHFGAREAAIVGHDWGAVVAWSVALAFPEYVRKLAALQVPPPAVWAANMSWRQALKSWYMLFFQVPELPEWAISANDFASLQRTFKQTARPGTFNETDIAVYKAALNQPAALTSAINYYRANFKRLGQNFLSLLSKREGGQRVYAPRVRVPTLFIYGERDFAVLPETVRGVGAYVAAPYTELRLPQSNHWVQQESHVEVNAALLSFLEEG
ncbi:MAG TPA: alpha/beta hydrolase [Pyrinomonadaceae bacterium]|jgi:pimeloyl-ACP methyl ester carboxylesterase|nr:alpha/beta hydrolase [Pyrinomonadaceae bacterium]